MALDFAAGCLGGCAGVIVGHPLDTVKVNLQIQDHARPKYKGTLDCLRSLIIRDGFRGLYRGLTSPLAGVAGINAIVFGVYGNSQRYMNNPQALYSIFMAGVSAGLAQSLICSPMELAKTRLQISGDCNGPVQCLKKIYKTEGCKGIFRGLGITVLREIPAFGTYFLSYELLTRSSDGCQISTATMLFAGGTAGVISWIVAYPIDVIKTRMQVDGMSGAPKYLNSLHCLKDGWHKEGHKFLVRGLGPTLVRAFPVNAACFTVVTWTLRLAEGNIPVGTKQEESIWTRCGDAVTAFQIAEAV